MSSRKFRAAVERYDVPRARIGQLVMVKVPDFVALVDRIALEQDTSPDAEQQEHIETAAEILASLGVRPARHT